MNIRIINIFFKYIINEKKIKIKKKKYKNIIYNIKYSNFLENKC